MTSFNRIDNMVAGTAIEALPQTQLRELQRALSYIGYNLGTIDGRYGPKTRNSWAEHVADGGAGDPLAITDSGRNTLKGRIAAMTAALAAPLGTKNEVKAAIGGVAKAMGLGLKTQIAYMLATAHHETNKTFEPVREAYWVQNAEAWRRRNLRYYPYYGRGLVQLTWKKNYQKYRDILEVDMVNDPDLAMQPVTSLFVIVHGFKTGTFTERKLTEFVNANQTDYKNARRCINGLDKWDVIKALAEDYEAGL